MIYDKTGKMVSISVPPASHAPKGYEYTGEYRQPKHGEYYAGPFGAHHKSGHDARCHYFFILRKVASYRYGDPKDPSTWQVL